MGASNLIRKSGEKKFPKHPMHLKWRVSVPHSSERLSALTAIDTKNTPQRIRITHAEAQQIETRAKICCTNSRTTLRQTSLGSKATQELKKMISAQVKNKLERVEINLANTSTTKLIFVLFSFLT